MSNWSKSVIYGGIYPAPLGNDREDKGIAQKMQMSPVAAGTIHSGAWTGAETRSESDCSQCDRRNACKYKKLVDQLEKFREMAERSWKTSKIIFIFAKNNLQKHISEKQELYWPVLIAIILLLFVFASKIASAGSAGIPNNLPIEDTTKLNLIGFNKKSQPEALPAKDPKKEKANDDGSEELKSDVAKIVKNTPMSAMVEEISKKDRTVAAFIVGIAMKESKFGVYSPKLGGRDCYNYWGYKGGGKTVAGGYTCFSSPEEAVNAVSKTIERMVAKGVRTPAQAISWKCGSSCAGHDAGGVRKWISDVAINFYKINS